MRLHFPVVRLSDLDVGWIGLWPLSKPVATYIEGRKLASCIGFELELLELLIF